MSDSLRPLDSLELIALQGATAVLRRLAEAEQGADAFHDDHPSARDFPRLIASLDMEPAVLRQLADQLDRIRRRLGP